MAKRWLQLLAVDIYHAKGETSQTSDISPSTAVSTLQVVAIGHIGGQGSWPWTWGLQQMDWQGNLRPIGLVCAIQYLVYFVMIFR